MNPRGSTSDDFVRRRSQTPNDNYTKYSCSPRRRYEGHKGVGWFIAETLRARTVNPAFPFFGCGFAALGLCCEVSFPLSVTAPASIEVYPSHFTIQESSGVVTKNPSQFKASSIPRQTQRQSINFTVMGPCGIPLACRKFAHSLHDFLAGQKLC